MVRRGQHGLRPRRRDRALGDDELALPLEDRLKHPKVVLDASRRRARASSATSSSRLLSDASLDQHAPDQGDPPVLARQAVPQSMRIGAGDTPASFCEGIQSRRQQRRGARPILNRTSSPRSSCGGWALEPGEPLRAPSRHRGKVVMLAVTLTVSMLFGECVGVAAAPRTAGPEGLNWERCRKDACPRGPIPRRGRAPGEITARRLPLRGLREPAGAARARRVPPRPRPRRD